MKKVGCTHDELQKASTIISQLNPNPRAMIDETDYKINTIIPDVILEKINNKWNVIINDGSCPNLLVSENYLNMYNDKNQTKDVDLDGTSALRRPHGSQHQGLQWSGEIDAFIFIY